MDQSWTGWLSRWTEAGLIDAAAAARIRAFEAEHAGSSRLRWPILIALAFGGVMICGGILLFVAANWDVLSPMQRFALVLLMVASFHVAGVLLHERFPAMSETMHAVGTVVLGAGIALSGQIFNLEEHWPGGVMLWALGAGIGWVVLRHSAQMALLAILAPAWLVCEWLAAAGPTNIESRNGAVAASGLMLLALIYLSAAGPATPSGTRRVLVWIGAVGMAVCGPLLASVSFGQWSYFYVDPISPGLRAFAWAVAIGGPLALAALLRRTEAWVAVLAAAWVVGSVYVPVDDLAQYGWWAFGAVGLAAWGVRDARAERINIGAIALAIVVLAFYFSRVLDKLGRSAALVGLGLLFLLGGWALESMRRRLVRKSRERT